MVLLVNFCCFKLGISDINMHMKKQIAQFPLRNSIFEFGLLRFAKLWVLGSLLVI